MDLYIANIKDTNDKQIDNLVTILNTDKKLQKKLGSNNKIISSSEFIKYNNEWAKKNNAEIFAIILNNEAIGLISLSKILRKAGTANIGYWIGSNYWHKGHTINAFGQILEFAKKEGIKMVSCSINKENRESIAIWKKFNADFEDKGEKIVPSLYL